MRQKILTTILVAAMMLPCTAFAKDYPQKFWDVPKDHWAFMYIADLADRGVINGYEDGSFKPEHTVTRAEWAKIMVDAAGVQVSDNALYFTDMEGHWANQYVNAAKNYLTGFIDGSYRPDQAATREDVTVAMVRLKGYDLTNVDYSKITGFTDSYSISDYAKGYVAVAVQQNLISGFEDNTFRGQDTLARSEAATLLYRAFQHGNADKAVTAPTTPITPNNSGTTKISDDEYVQQAQTKQEQTKQEEPEPEQTTPEQKEPTAEPAAETKPYRVDTLAKMEDTIVWSSAGTNRIAQKDDFLYYLDRRGKDLYAIDTIKDKTEKILTAGDSLEYGEESGTISRFGKVFYDNVTERVLATCYVSVEDDFSDGDIEFTLVDVETKTEVPIPEGKQGKRYSALSDEGYGILYVDDGFWMQYLGSVRVDRGSQNINDVDGGVFSDKECGRITRVIERDNCLYLMAEHGIYKYDFQELTPVLNVEYAVISGSENGFYIVSSAKKSFIRTDFNGKKEFEILVDDIEVKDKKSFNPYSCLAEMYENSNGDIIIYDVNNTAFRKISKNQ